MTYIKNIVPLIILLFSAAICRAGAYDADFEYGGMWFRITSAGPNPTCALAKPPKGYKYPKRFVIPSVVQFKGVDLTVTAIGTEAFSRAKKITTIIVPPSVTKMEYLSFQKEGYYSDFIIECDSIIFEDGDALLKFSSSSTFGGVERSNYPNAKYMYLGRNLETSSGMYRPEDEPSCGSFREMFLLTDLEIGDSVTFIPALTFHSLYHLKNVSFGKNVSVIGNFAFEDCHRLNNVVLPEGLTYLGLCTFGNCHSLTNITFGENIKKIHWPFMFSENITEIYCKALTPPELDLYQKAIYFKATLYVPSRSIPLYRSAKGWEDFITIKPMNPALY
ncbi:MAG: leucine-rich repeat domain-containing protein [Bacteroides sp.]|nr:leucine-rich repeat domain-containing protein [Bacteroides sp.]MCM1414209.1 leucine-rich repeat domain-containing protein [Bacteroides sp.]MCM1472031.1 leucine-rich repeat domain-containing protein [Bacteroides sp.]